MDNKKKQRNLWNAAPSAASRIFPGVHSGLAASFYLVSLLILNFLPIAQASSPSPSAIESQLARLQDLKESHIHDAILQLTQLKQQLSPTANLDDRLLVLAELISFNLDDDREADAQKLIAELDQLAQRTNSDKARALERNFDAMMQYNHGHLLEARKKIEAASQLAEKISQPKLIRRVAIVSSMIAAELGDFNAALQQQLIALSTMDAADPHDNLPRINALANISAIYLDIKNPNRALGYVDQGIKIAKDIGAGKSITRLKNIEGTAYSDLKDYQHALLAHKLALDYAQKIADGRQEYIALANLTDTYYRLHDFDDCISYADRALTLAEKLAIPNLIPGAYVNAGLCKMARGQVEAGVKMVNQGIAGMREENATVEMVRALRSLANAYEGAGMYKEANKAIEEQDELSDELFQLSRDRNVAEIQARYDETEWQKKVALLNEKNDLQTAELKNTSLQRLFSVVAFFLVAVIAYLLIRSKEHSRKLAIQENLNKSKFVADAAHDLRQPMQAIGNLLDAARHALERDDKDKSLELIKLTQTATRVMRTSFNSVLELSRLESGLVKPDYAAFDLKNLIDEMLISFGQFANERGIAIKVKFNPQRSLIIRSDRVLLGRVLSNLILNAIKYGDPVNRIRPIVLIGIVSLKDRYRIDILDNGIGIAPGDQKNIFKPFYQVNNPERDPEKGLGLGLSNVRAILQLLEHHEYRMNSLVGVGTRFSVFLPKGDPQQFAGVDSEDQLPTSELAGIYVLFVEDNLMVRHSTAELFREYGILCEACHSYADTIERLAALERMPDLLITDYSLPDNKTANDVIAGVRNEFGCDLPTIVITGEGEDIRSLVQLKNLTLLQKPLDPMALLRGIVQLSKKGS